MPTRVLVSLALLPVVGLWVEVCDAWTPPQTEPSPRESFDSSATNSGDAEP